jgi:hypothetical protein
MLVKDLQLDGSRNTGHAWALIARMAPFVVYVTQRALQNMGIVPTLHKVLLALPTKGKDSVFRFIIEYSSLRDFGP